MSKRDTSKHANRTTWQKGKSGNPGGRSPRVGPNGETWTQLLRSFTPEAADRLKQLIMSPDEEISLKAISVWAPYAWGKPKETVELDAKVKGNMPVINLTVTRPDEPGEDGGA